MTATNDGGAAFPIPAVFSPVCGTLPGNDGMSLRDWYAGMALSGMLSNSDFDFQPEKIAELADLYATAMLALRDKNLSSKE